MIGIGVADPGRVYLDANVFIRFGEAPPGSDAAEATRHLLTALRDRRIPTATSELTLAEVFVHPERTGNLPLKKLYLQILNFSRTVSLIPVTRDILMESTRYRATAHPSKLDPGEDKRNFLPDAIHVVTAHSFDAGYFVSGDIRIRLPDGMTRVDPSMSGVDGLLRTIAA